MDRTQRGNGQGPNEFPVGDGAIVDNDDDNDDDDDIRRRRRRGRRQQREASRATRTRGGGVCGRYYGRTKGLFAPSHGSGGSPSALPPHQPCYFA